MKSRGSGFSRAKLEAGRNGLSLCIARDEARSCNTPGKCYWSGEKKGEVRELLLACFEGLARRV